MSFWQTVSLNQMIIGSFTEGNAYLLKEWNLNQLAHLSGDEFKSAVQAFFEDPFAEYPELDQVI